MRILLLSAYHTASHQYWCKALMQGLPECDWTLLSLPPRYFSWRFRGNAMSWLMEQEQTLAQPYNLLVATSMADMACIKGLVPSLAACPSVLYFHENQFAYPSSGQQQDAVSAQITSIYSALASDKLLFNSEYNRNSFFDGAFSLLKKMPDHLNAAKVYERLAQKSEVLPVPLALPQVSQMKPAAKANAIPELVWNHRWEYDKSPDRLLLFVDELLRRDLAFTLHIVGQQFRQRPPEMDLIAEKLGSHLGEFGYIADTVEYHQLLARCDFVLSTALHDFQGLSVMEAVAAGCQPVLPNRVAYTGQYATSFLYESDIKLPANEARSAVNLLERLINTDKADYKPPRIGAFSSEKLIPKYRACFESVRMSRPSH